MNRYWVLLFVYCLIVCYLDMILLNFVGKEVLILMNKFLSILSFFVSKFNFFCKFLFFVDNLCIFCLVFCCFFFVLFWFFFIVRLFFICLFIYFLVFLGGCFFWFGLRGLVVDGFLLGWLWIILKGEVGGVRVDDVMLCFDWEGEFMIFLMLYVLYFFFLLVD